MLKTIGIIDAPFKERFGIPRQPGLAQNIKGIVRIEPEFNDPAYFKELESFSHIWLSFIFDNEENNQPTIRPPRLGGKKRVGTFASRSPHRPNRLGLSVVRLDEIRFDKQIQLLISGHDLLDQTRIVDIKPYIPKWDSISEASDGWLEKNRDELFLKVKFDLTFELDDQIKEELISIIQLDPRPLHQRDQEHFSTKTYSMKYHFYDVHWKMTDNNTAVIFQIDEL